MNTTKADRGYSEKLRSGVCSVLKAAPFLLVAFCLAYLLNMRGENAVLKKVIERLSADSRIAEVVVTDVRSIPHEKKSYTTIKFLEYDTRGRSLPAQYFTFTSDIIQFQSLVIRFDDFYIRNGHPLKGKSAYLFMKAFALQGREAEVFEINEVNQVPSGYRSAGKTTIFEKNLWQRFWRYALDPQKAARAGIKNAQIEAPGTKFIPGLLYTIRIEHDGGMRVDASPLPQILKKVKR
ncbi:MAG: hypothetical protein KKC84_02870 [Candidatus Omnitrophica bacterium]|nr:hypothetical protein [Candidatus Omnitrophota bacterium]